MKELRQGVRDEGRSRKSCFAERGSCVGVRLDNKGSNRKQRRVSSNSKRNGTKLRGKRQPSNSMVEYGGRGDSDCQYEWPAK